MTTFATKSRMTQPCSKRTLCLERKVYKRVEQRPTLQCLGNQLEPISLIAMPRFRCVTGHSGETLARQTSSYSGNVTPNCRSVASLEDSQPAHNQPNCCVRQTRGLATCDWTAYRFTLTCHTYCSESKTSATNHRAAARTSHLKSSFHRSFSKLFATLTMSSR